MLISEIKKKRITEYLGPNSFGGVLLIFEHGLGDLCLFTPLFEELKKQYPNCVFKIGSSSNRNFSSFSSDCVVIDDFRSIQKIYNYIFRISYPEPSVEDKNNGIIKPYLCNLKEIGLKNFKWKPYKRKIELNNYNSKLVGVHFTARTNYRMKNVTDDKIELIWNEIKEAGFEPFEINMNSYDMRGLEEFCPFFLNDSNSLRFKKCNLLDMINKISECKCFIGIESGPLYLASTILGFENCIGLERYLKFSWYCPQEFDKVDIKFYKSGSIYNLLKERHDNF